MKQGTLRNNDGQINRKQNKTTTTKILQTDYTMVLETRKKKKQQHKSLNKHVTEEVNSSCRRSESI